MKKYLLSIILITAVSAVLYSCSSSNITEKSNVQDIYTEALHLYTTNDFIEAQKLFDVIKLQYPASQYADDAQYYLAEINFKRKEYILGAFNYSLLRRIYPQSEYSKMALFKTALCNYELSPDYDRDQEYTYKAITAFSEFQAAYPRDSLFDKASDYIKELRNKLGYKEYNIGIIYEKIDILKGALVYFNSVIDDYSDTDSFEPAYFEKIKVLYAMKKLDDLRGFINNYQKLFPKSSNLSAVTSIEKSLK